VAAKRKKLVLAVIDSLKPEMLDLAIEEGRAPALAALVGHGTYVRNCVSTFPSVTPVASAAIATGCGPAQHHIPSMNWYHRGEERYIEYGSSFPATRVFGVVRSLYDTVYNMNLAHLTRAHRTVFEHLDDAGLRTACTTYLIYRGRTRHEPSGVSVYRRIAEAAQFRHPVWGPGELFYADLFDSRNTGCTSALGMPGQRDRHTGCVGAYLVENDLFDFLLFSLPDNDTHSHKVGPDGQVASIAEADQALERIMQVAGGPEAFLEEHAVIVMSDHSQVTVEESVNLAGALGDWRVLLPADPAPVEADLAVCPSARSGGVYVLDESRRDELVPPVVDALAELPGVDLTIWRDDGWAAVRAHEGTLRFRPGDALIDRRGNGWELDTGSGRGGEEAVLALEANGGRVDSEVYPDALNRLWSALDCPHSGDVLVSASQGTEFADWGGADHVGGGSHGSLHRDDSEGVLLLCGVDAPARERWSLTDVTPLVLQHFGVPSAG
jgi:Type I phosphodiesterase / nucleotide pyrophosphatase